MTDIFPYDELTWPEVAALPRDTPLILPLGEGYDLAKVTEAFGQPTRIGLLPAIPYGWRGSGLAVPEPVLGQLVANLLDSLRDDGFSRVYALTPQGIDLNLGPNRLALPHPTQFTLSPLHPVTLSPRVIILPIGHTEQHGYHLPMNTDTLIIEAIGMGTAVPIPDLAYCLPVFPYGVSTHRASFAGTLNCGGRAFEDFWLAVVDVLVGRGFDRFYLMSGHGGNCSFLVNVVKYAGERHRRIFCATAWLHTSGHMAAPVLQATRHSARGGMGHAGELETAMILHLRPDLVHMERVVDETDFVSTPNYYMDWIEGGDLVANPPWDDDTKTGAYGAGSLATAVNGKLWLEAGIAEKVAHVREIHEQHRRREERRLTGYGLWGVGVSR
ncbi:MAG: creatininase family protein [Anaerolineae bacterium]|nr:creatininase family protein [Anaerolineae bacterium]